jgi:pimeloyl-ACP methyl ester carboxylesterase
MELSIRWPLLARALLNLVGKMVRYTSSMFAKSQADGLHEVDLLYIEELVRQRGQNDVMKNDVMRSVAEAFRQGGGGVMVEYRLWGLPWGFSLEQVSVPEHVFHGEVDQMVPLHHAEDLAARVPHASLSVLPRTGHLSIMRHVGSMLDALAME